MLAFQSTRPLRGATLKQMARIAIRYFNPRAPCGARPSPRAITKTISQFQSTRPLRGATIISSTCSPSPRIFQSTRPLRGATPAQDTEHGCCSFQSTRPLRGATYLYTVYRPGPSDFNPRAPCGARLRSDAYARSHQDFNPRAPCGARPCGPCSRAPPRHFNPRAPCGARPITRLATSSTASFQSTRPLRGATAALVGQLGVQHISIHAPLAGRDVRKSDNSFTGPFISIHAPLAGRDSKFDEFLSANLHKSNKRDLLSEEKMRHSLPQTAHVSHFRSFFGAKLQRFSARLPFALRS